MSTKESTTATGRRKRRPTRDSISVAGVKVRGSLWAVFAGIAVVCVCAVVVVAVVTGWASPTELSDMVSSLKP